MRTEEYLLWFEKADDFLKWANDNLADGNYSLVCFLSQQAVEIALKGYCYSKRVIPTKVHDLLQILNTCKKAGLKFDEELTPKLSKLSEYYMKTRYPDIEDRGLNNKQVAEEALESAKEIIGKVKSSLPSA